MGGDVEQDDRLGTAERRYYSEMCNQLFQKYTTIKARSVEAKSGRVWKYFVLEKMAAMCKLCTKSVKLASKGSTTNLTVHMQRCHGKEFDDMVETEAIKKVTVLCKANATTGDASEVTVYISQHSMLKQCIETSNKCEYYNE